MDNICLVDLCLLNDMYLHRTENYSDGGWVYYRDDVAMDHIGDAKNK